MHGRDLLLQGVRWQVANGESVSFWNQKGVPYEEDFYIRHPRGPFINSMKVSDFITHGQWDVNKLHARLFPNEAYFISRIPISSTGGARF